MAPGVSQGAGLGFCASTAPSVRSVSASAIVSSTVRSGDVPRASHSETSVPSATTLAATTAVSSAM